MLESFIPFVNVEPVFWWEDPQIIPRQDERQETRKAVNKMLKTVASRILC